MLVKIALLIIIFWLIGLVVPHDIGAVMYTLPVIATIMIMVSGHRRRLNNPNDN
jgi:predicted histidine transporter YuiF (NhaC family)